VSDTNKPVEYIVVSTKSHQQSQRVPVISRISDRIVTERGTFSAITGQLLYNSADFYIAGRWL